MAQNFPTFRGLLRGAICTRTQAQFANESGLSAEHLNRMLNADTIHRPSKQTLHKIASVAKNGITYQVLKDALDNEDPSFRQNMPDPEKKLEQAKEDFKPSFEDAVYLTMEYLSELTKNHAYPVVTHSIATFLDTLMEDVSNAHTDTLDISYEMGTARPYCCKNHDYASHYIRTTLTMADYSETATSDMIVYYTEIQYKKPDTTPGIQYVIQNISCAVVDIMDLCGLPPAAMDAHSDLGDNSLEAAMQDDFYVKIAPAIHFREAYKGRPGTSTEERLLESIFGIKTRFSRTIDGFGFWLKDIPDALPAFVQKHLDVILTPYSDEPDDYATLKANIEAAIQAGDLAALKQAFLDVSSTGGYMDDNARSDCGFGAAIAVVMEEETGFPFHYYSCAEDLEEFPGLSDNDCILLSNEDQIANHIQREAMLHATTRYASELGLQKIGDILFTNVKCTFRKPKTYTLHPNEPDDDQEEEELLMDDAQYTMDFTTGQKPEKTGLYGVRLKDGRYLKCIYLQEQNVWVMWHREWSDLIEAWCPRMLTMPANNENA